MKTAIDLFCGSGAVTLGLKSAGFRVVGAVDIDPMACVTYRANHPEVDLVEDDIGNVDPKRFLEAVNGELDLLAVCAPCQPFSNRNRNRTPKDGRSKLVLNALSFIKALQPKLVFFENVPGLGRQPVFIELANNLSAMGYQLGEPRKIDAVDLGVPQRRQRMILIGAKYEMLLRQASNIKFSTKRTVREAIQELPIPPLGGKAKKFDDTLHFSRAHAPITLERLRHIPRDGGSRESLPEHLQLSCHKGRKKHSFPDSYGRLKWDDVAPTLTTGCTDLTKGLYAQPEQDRAITLREAARLQSFPDSYVFKGNASQIATQIGNAVPPGMMAGLARSFYGALYGNTIDPSS